MEIKRGLFYSRIVGEVFLLCNVADTDFDDPRYELYQVTGEDVGEGYFNQLLDEYVAENEMRNAENSGDLDWIDESSLYEILEERMIEREEDRKKKRDLIERLQERLYTREEVASLIWRA